MTKKRHWPGEENEKNDIDKVDIDASPPVSSSNEERSTSTTNMTTTTTSSTSATRSRGGTGASPRQRSAARTPVTVINLVNLDSPNEYSYASTDSARKKRRARSCGHDIKNVVQKDCKATDSSRREKESYRLDSDRYFNKVGTASTSVEHTINTAQTRSKDERRKKRLKETEVVHLDDDDSDESVVMVEPPKQIISNAPFKPTVCFPSAAEAKLNHTHKSDLTNSKQMESHTSKLVKKSSTSNKTMVQQTLFGNIVQQIQNTDVSKLPNKPLEYDKKRSSLKLRGGDLDMDTPYEAKVESGFFSAKSSCTLSQTLSSQSLEQRYQRALDILQNTFNISSLRALQPNAIRTALAQKSQIIVMATGGGKSLCYQLPALVFTGVTIVVSPLIALMVDQVQGLLQKGVEAAMISSSNSAKENQMIMQRLLGKNHDERNSKSTKTKSSRQHVSNKTATTFKPLKIVYCTPELIQTNKFRAVLTHLYQNNELSLIAIDEAHCLSTWGEFFFCTFPFIDC